MDRVGPSLVVESDEVAVLPAERVGFTDTQGGSNAQHHKAGEFLSLSAGPRIQVGFLAALLGEVTNVSPLGTVQERSG